MRQNGCAIGGIGGNSDLKLTRQKGELGMQCTPLAQDFAVRAGVELFALYHTGELIGRNISNAVSTGLNGVHLYFCKVSQYVGDSL